MNVVESLTPRQGLRVLVTAGASGIGLAIAKAFVQAGARVHVCDIDSEALAALRTHQWTTLYRAHYLADEEMCAQHVHGFLYDC